MRIAIVGTRGIPANYSGFETCVQETATRFAGAGHGVRVYCRKGRVGDDTTKLNGIELTTLPYVRGKFSETFTHTFASVLHCLFHRVDVVHLYGAGNGWFVPILRLAGIRVVFLVDGIDWERAKWGPLARIFLRWGAKIGCWSANSTVADSTQVIARMAKTLPASSLEYVPYGARILSGRPERTLHKLGLTRDDYYLFVGRFVPEKNVHLLVKAFEAANTSRTLVVVGGASYDSAYEARVRSTTCTRILFPGFVYGEEYEDLLLGCYAYVQPSALEGTSPSLLAAMGAGACVLVSDIPENKETVGKAGFYFRTNDVEHLRTMLERLDGDAAAVRAIRVQAVDRVRRCYSWDVVADQLLSLSIARPHKP